MIVVHIDTGYELRGGQRQLLRLARGLRARGHKQLIVCPEGCELETRSRQEGFQVFDLPAHDLGHAHGILQLRQQLRVEPAEVLHAHDGRGQTLSWLASLGLPVRRVASRRVTFMPGARVRHRFIYTHTCHAVIAVSQFVRKLLISSGVPSEKIEVIPDGVEIPEQLPTVEERCRARGMLGIGEQDFVVGHVGAFTPEKGQDVAIEAMRLLAASLPEARMLLVGNPPGEMLTRMQNQARDLQGSVKFLGNLEELSEFFAAIDLFVMPSRAEGLGSAVLLAMAQGRPVVASRVGGLPEIVEAGKSGWLVEPGSPRELAEAIVAAASDRARLARLGTCAREQGRQFSNDTMLDRTEALYIRLTRR